MDDCKKWANKLEKVNAIESLLIKKYVATYADGSEQYWLWLHVRRDITVWRTGDCAQTRVVSKEVLDYIHGRMVECFKAAGFKVEVESEEISRKDCKHESYHRAEFQFQLGSLEDARERAYKYADYSFPMTMAPEGKTILKEEVHPKMQEFASEVREYPSEHIWHYCPEGATDFLDGNYFPVAVDNRHIDEMRKMVDTLRNKFPTLKCRIDAENQKVGQLFYDKEHGKIEGPITRKMFDPFVIPVPWDQIDV